ncbi:hypothetical protein HNR33_001956 [Brassicibacter mesophilus]|jgi:hypothetical protein
MSFVKGNIITSLTPVLDSTLLIATIIDIISIVPSSSVIAYMKLLNIPMTDWYNELVAISPNINIPIIHSNVICVYLIHLSMLTIL